MFDGVGFHWHGYVRDPENTEGPEGRVARLAEAAKVILAAPLAVSSWVAEQIYDADPDPDARFTVWSWEDCRWVALCALEGSRLVMEYRLIAARAESLYAAVDLATGDRLEVFAEAVTAVECDEHGPSRGSLRDYRAPEA